MSLGTRYRSTAESALNNEVKRRRSFLINARAATISTAKIRFDHQTWSTRTCLVTRRPFSVRQRVSPAYESGFGDRNGRSTSLILHLGLLLIPAARMDFGSSKK
jgi:hypothetical protein